MDLLAPVFLLALFGSYAVARECGVPNQSLRLVNGSEAAPHAYPWVVALESSYSNDALGYVSLNCAGSVIDREWVLTAGHCVPVNYDYNGAQFDAAGLNVYFGKHNLKLEEEGEVKMNVPTARIMRHQNYSLYYQYDYDMALIHLPEPIEYTDNIQPVCLPKPGATKPDGTKVLNVGWGYLYNMQRTDVLQQGEDTVMDNAKCNDYYQPYGLDVTDRMMCTYSSPTAQCNGDSGGPVMWMNEDGQYIIQGTVSFSVKDPIEWCLPGMPAAQGNVANLMGWITENTGIQS